MCGNGKVIKFTRKWLWYQVLTKEILPVDNLVSFWCCLNHLIGCYFWILIREDSDASESKEKFTLLNSIFMTSLNKKLKQPLVYKFHILYIPMLLFEWSLCVCYCLHDYVPWCCDTKFIDKLILIWNLSKNINFNDVF